MLRRASIAALVLAVAFGMAAPGVAQTTNGVISGIISDAQGGVLPGVTVTAVSYTHLTLPTIYSV